MKGKYIVFEGISGAGKGTHLKLLSEYLEKNNKEFIAVKEPTEKLYSLIKEKWSKRRIPLENALLFAADRVSLVEETIKPSLKEGKIVLSDRSFISSLVYQSMEGLELAFLQEINSFVPEPDLILIFLTSSEEALRRIDKRSEKSSFENKEEIEKLIKKFKEISEKLPNAKIINSEESKEATHQKILKTLKEFSILSKAEK
ncbi:MAG TPA: dTMP kinase [archaeon]|nr:dTMP kinase [archaeon]